MDFDLTTKALADQIAKMEEEKKEETKTEVAVTIPICQNYEYDLNDSKRNAVTPLLAAKNAK